MKITNRKLFLLITLCCVILDQISKVFIQTYLSGNQNIIVIKNILSLEKVYNTGAAFSILQGSTFFLILISVCVLFIIAMYLFNKNSCISKLDSFSYGFISGGALGNLFDRLFLSYVVDFIQLDFINFPIFNLADIFINIGVIIFIVRIFINKK